MGVVTVRRILGRPTSGMDLAQDQAVAPCATSLSETYELAPGSRSRPETSGDRLGRDWTDRRGNPDPQPL